MTTIGVPRRRRDGEAKVRGLTRYVSDMPLHGLLHARLVLAAEAHARITAIDGSEALAVPGVVAVLTAAGPADRRRLRPGRRAAGPRGDRVGGPAGGARGGRERGGGRGRRRAGRGRRRAAARGDGPRGGDGAGRAGRAADRGAGRGRRRGGRAHRRARRCRGGREQRLGQRRGRAAAGQRRRRRGAGAVRRRGLRGRFRTSWVHQGYLEPQSAMAWVEPDGELVVQASTQGAFMARRHDRGDARAARWIGCACGRRRSAARSAASSSIPEPLVAAAALRAAPAGAARVRAHRGLRRRQPRARPADRPRARAARATATLTAIRGRVVGDRGGLGEMGVEGISAMLAAGPYRWEAHDLTAVGVVTNRVGAGAYRAPRRAAGRVRPGDADRPSWPPSWASTRSSCG